MSVTVAVYEYDESMDDEVLTSLGVHGGIFGKLTGDASIEEERELLENANSIRIGSSNYDYPSEILTFINGKMEVDAPFLAAIKEMESEYADDETGRYDAEEVYDWFAEREGREVFVKGL